MHKKHAGGGVRTARLKIAKKPVYFALDQRLVRRHKTLLFLAGLGQAAAVIAVIISALAPNIGNKAYAGSGAYSGPHGSDVFVMLVDTTKPGNTNNTQFRVQDSGDIGFNYSVDCDDDGNFEATGQTSEYTCNYSTPGTYSVVIDGNFHRIFYNGNDEADKILEVQQWGDQVWSSFGSAFYGASNLQITATDAPNLTSVTNMADMFGGASSLNSDLSTWDVSHVTNMSGMFRSASAFNQPLNDWDVSKVTDMNRMFEGASSFNQPLDGWNTSSVTNMRSLFNNARVFNQDISAWNMSSVNTIAWMFYNADAFNQPLNDWDVSKVTDMNRMFEGANLFNQSLNSWNTSSVQNMDGMFKYAPAFNGDISGWDTSSVTSMGDINYTGDGIFSGATSFNQDISGWDTSSVTSMKGLFNYATSFNQDISGWDMSNVTNAGNMFDNSGISPETYDLILTGWSGQLLHSNVTLGANGKSYCTASVARQSIVDNFNWTINDAGQACMPEVSTGGVVSVTDDSATLQINIIDDGGGNVYDAGIQYGTDSMNYGGTRSANSFGEGIQQVDLGSGNLQCETTYHYRAFIQNGAGTAHGDDATFTTAECPPPPQPYDLRLRASLLNTEPVKAGDTANYQIKAKNLGPGSAPGIYLYMDIPSETSFETASFSGLPDGFNGSCEDQGPISQAFDDDTFSGYDGNLVLCYAFGEGAVMGSGKEITVNLALVANSNFTSGSTSLRGLLFNGDELEVDTQGFYEAFANGAPLYSIQINNIVDLTYGQGDSDGDGIYDNVENAAPNNGDANNDGTPDSAQSNVGTFINPITGKYVALAVDDQCEVTDITIRAESANATQDKANDYPNGLMDFTLSCGTPGYTATVTQHYYGTSKDGFNVRKYNPSTKTYSTIDTASISESTIANQTVTQATYQVKDGSSLDLDGVEDGNIHDPAGLARKDWLAGTGQNLTIALYASFTLVTLGGSAYVLRRARRKSRPTYTTLR